MNQRTLHVDHSTVRLHTHARRYGTSRAHLRGPLLLLLASSALLAGCPLKTPRHRPERNPEAAALDIVVREGSTAPLVLDLGGSFYIHNLVMQARVDKYPDVDVTSWLGAQSDFSVLDWSGLDVMRNEWEASSRGATEQRFYGGAAWMYQKHTFEVDFLDQSQGVVAGPFSYSGDDYIIDRKVVMEWVNSPRAGSYGANAGDYSDLEVSSAGSYSGERDDIYLVEIATAGDTDGSAAVSVRSMRGDDNPEPVSVNSDTPIALGTLGAQIIFSASPTAAHLVAKDRWIVRCTAARGDDAPAKVGAATPAPAATFNALAEVRLMVPRDTVGEFELPDNTRFLRVRWSHRDLPYYVPIEPAPQTDIGYGLDIDLQLSPPRNGTYYEGTEKVQVKLLLKDHAGHLLHAEDGLPTYREMVENRANGLRYYGATDFPCFPFFAECGLTFMRIGVWGPLDRVKQNYTPDEPKDWFGWELNLPDQAVTRTPSRWDEPISNRAEVEIPQEAFPGTYVALAKVTRRYMGEAVSQIKQVRFQVKSPAKTDFVQEVGNCKVCHLHDATLDRLRHGTEDWRICKFCHVPPRSGTAGLVVHQIHYFAQSFPPQRNDCTWCHLTAASNARVSQIMCGSCHDAIHAGEHGDAIADPYAQCGETCHAEPPNGHVQFPPQ